MAKIIDNYILIETIG